MRLCWNLITRFYAGVIARLHLFLRLCKHAVFLLTHGHYYAFFQGIDKKISSVPIAKNVNNFLKYVYVRFGIRHCKLEPRPNVVNILTPSFFDFDGNDMFCGGAERYLIELSRIIRQLGYETAVYQCANSSWVRWYNDLCVTGIPAFENMELLNREFHRRVPPGAMTIYFSFILAYPYTHENNTGISHGIWWDQEVYQSPAYKGNSIRKCVLQSIKNCKHIISVDTNTINWVRGTDIRQGGKMTYIPNFVDLNIFTPAESQSHPKKIVILFPRRLNVPRGFWLMAELMPFICDHYPQVEFHIVGKGHPAELERVNQLLQQYPERVRYFHYEPEEMHKAYRTADIALIPTLASEGTSLSCLEAMASGNAVIATDVGGLTDLIIDGHSGLLVPPKKEKLRDAMEKLISDHELRHRLQHNAREVSKQFSLELWQARWKQYLSKLLPEGQMQEAYSCPRTIFLHPSTPGITWERAKQRPQQLFEAFSELRYQSFFVSDTNWSPPPKTKPIPKNSHLHLLWSDNEAYLTHPVLYVYHAYLYPNLAKWPNRTLIYDILDDPAIHAPADRLMGRASHNNYLYYHEKLLDEADIVITSSLKLHEQYRSQRPDILIVPNAVKAQDFASNCFQRPADLPPPGSTIIGYYGALAEWFDFDLMQYVVEHRRQYQFIFIGLTNCLQKVEQFIAKNSNARYLGEKPYELLPSYLAHFDAATIPFVLNDVTHAVSPVKLFEYMAGRKPVVSTDIFECRKYELVLIGKTAEEFAARLDQAILLGKNENHRRELWNCALANSWKARAGIILEALQALPVKSRGGLTAHSVVIPHAKTDQKVHSTNGT
jgi:glycosyltransferase involved in cell wall biosynthesis